MAKLIIFFSKNKKKHRLTIVSATTVNSGRANATNVAFRQVVIDPKKNIANIPIIFDMLVIVKNIPRTDGWLQNKWFVIRVSAKNHLLYRT